MSEPPVQLTAGPQSGARLSPPAHLPRRRESVVRRRNWSHRARLSP